jgi:hypothetical protein
MPFIGGSLSWDTLFYDCFGQDATELLDQLSSPHANTPDGNYLAPFGKLYGLGILLCTTHLAEIGHLESIPAYVLSMTDMLSGLRSFYIISKQNLAHSSTRTLTDIASEYDSAAKNLRALCYCYNCYTGVPTNKKFCWLSIAETMLVLTYLVGRCVFKSDIRPKKLGVVLFYQDINKRRNHRTTLTADTFLSHLTMGSFQSSPSFLYSSIMTLFTGSPSRMFFSCDYPSAHSNGTLYCYLNKIPRRSLALLPTRLCLSVRPNPPAPSFQSRPLSKFPLPSTSRSFQSSITLREKWILSEIILYELKDRKIEKWGWVFYRTTYEDDEAWDMFKRTLNLSVRSIISLGPRSELNEAMFNQLE